MSLLSILIVLLVFCIVIWAARSLMSAFGIGDPIHTVVIVLLVLICLFWLLQQLGVMGGPVLRLR